MKVGRKPNKHLKILIADLAEKGYNSSEIAGLINKTRQNVEYHLGLIHSQGLQKNINNVKLKDENNTTTSN